MIHGAGDQGIALHAIAKAYADHRDFDLALQSVQTMTSEFDKVSALADIASRSFVLVTQHFGKP